MRKKFESISSIFSFTKSIIFSKLTLTVEILTTVSDFHGKNLPFKVTRMNGERQSLLFTFDNSFMLDFVILLQKENIYYRK